MNPKKPVIAYYRAVRTKAGQATPTVDQQRLELTRRLAMSPHRELIAEFIEEEIGQDGDLLKRRQLEKVLAEVARLGDCIIATPRMAKKSYRYKNLPDLLTGQKVIYLREPLPEADRRTATDHHGHAASIAAGQIRPIGEDFDRVWEEIEANCSDILDVLRGIGTRYLYRGVRSSTFTRAGIADGLCPLFVSRPMDDKPALETSPGIHGLAVDWMKANGFIAHRGNSVYVTTHPGVAQGYTERIDQDGTESVQGAVYAIFPCNGYNFTWSRQFPDLGLNLQDAVDPLDLLFAADLVATGLREAILGEHEILLSGVPYYAVELKKHGMALNDKLGIKPSNKAMWQPNRWSDLLDEI